MIYITCNGMCDHLFWKAKFTHLPPLHHRDMSHRKVHSLGKVPFSRENEPGISKESYKEFAKDLGQETPKLPPPPCQSNIFPRVVGHDLQIPLPPGPFRPLSRSSSKKAVKRDDPFVAAYMKCTKSDGDGKFSTDKRTGGGKCRLGMSMLRFSCVNSCQVKDDILVWWA